MTYQAILAVVTGKDGDMAVLEAAHSVARHFQAHIDVLFVGELPRPLPCLKGGVAPHFVATVVRDADAAVRLERDAAHRTFTLWMSRNGLCVRDCEHIGPTSALLTASWLEWAGSRKQIGVQGRYADLIVMVRPGSSVAASSGLMLGGDMESALLDSARPVLFVPADWTVFPHPSDWGALVAWNGSPQAARAVGYGLPFLVAAKSTTVFAGEEPDKPAGHGVKGLNQLRRYLSLHVVHAASRQRSIHSSDAGEAILAEATACDAELIIMGAFTHSRVRELILGGATQHVLTHAHVPVLMAH